MVSLWYVVSVIIIVGLLNASFQTMIAGYMAHPVCTFSDTF